MALFGLVVIAGLLGGSPASAASSCPTQTYLRFGHLAYAAVSIPPSVRVRSGADLGTGTVDEPTNASGCHRAEKPARVMAAAALAPPVALLVAGRPHTIFVIGHRCGGMSGQAYWDCLLAPLAFDGRQYTATSYPSTPAPRRTLPLGASIGKAKYHGRQVTVRRIQGVDPTVAVGISGQPSYAFLSPHTCPYSGFSNLAQYDDLFRCLQSPVWFTFDPPGSQPGGTVVARADRQLPRAAEGAQISLVKLGVVADYVPTHHGALTVVGKAAEQLAFHVPSLDAGLYEAVVSCPGCSSQTGAGDQLYPAGSILVTAKPSTSAGIRIISYALLFAFLFAAFFAFRTYRRRHPRRGPGVATMLGQMLMGPGPAGSSRRGRSWTEDAEARPPARAAPKPGASPRAKRKARGGRDGRPGSGAGRRGRKRGGG
jgi:hypothetical protein